jgi:hypothetical protein
MAFQDNSGTIILDAVLTDIGRKRMAQGNFKVRKFLLGDDEIDYGLYDSTSGGTQTNIENTPIMEAFANEHADINYGLLNFPSDDIVYIPSLRKNELLSESVKLHGLGTGSYFMAANIETSRKITSILGQDRFHLEHYALTRNKLFIESGIQTADDHPIPHDSLSRDRYILNTGLYDKYFVVSCDSRFVDKALASNDATYFYNDNANNLYANFEPLRETINVSLVEVVDKFSSFIVSGTPNKIYQNLSGLDTNYSAFRGPRGSIMALNLKLLNELTGDSTTTRNQRYEIFGKIDQYVLGGTDKFDVIETAIYIEGMATSSTLIIPIKILRYSGT